MNDKAIRIGQSELSLIKKKYFMQFSYMNIEQLFDPNEETIRADRWNVLA